MPGLFRPSGEQLDRRRSLRESPSHVTFMLLDKLRLNPRFAVNFPSGICVEKCRIRFVSSDIKSTFFGTEMRNRLKLKTFGKLVQDAVRFSLR